MLADGQAGICSVPVVVYLKQMLTVKNGLFSRFLTGHKKYVALLVLLLSLAAPLVLGGRAFAELPFDNWCTVPVGNNMCDDGAKAQHARWVNRATIHFYGSLNQPANFYDIDSSDRTYIFSYRDPQNPGCESTIRFGAGAGNIYPDPDGATNMAELVLKQHKANSVDCDTVANLWGDPSGPLCGVSGHCQAVRYLPPVEDVDARLISFFLDTDGNMKGINRDQAISFKPTKYAYNGLPVYVRTDQESGQCQNIIFQISGPPNARSSSGGQWGLFSLKQGGATTFNDYYTIVNQATTNGSATVRRDACSDNKDAFMHTYMAGLDSQNPTAGGYYTIYVGEAANAGLSKAAVNSPTNGGTPGSGNDNSQLVPTCESNGFSLNWILCPIFNATAGFVNWLLKDLIIPILNIDNGWLNPGSSVYRIWSTFRVYADIFLLIVLIVVVLGQAIGTSIAEALTVRTFFTRLLLVVILINVSIYLMAGFMDIINILSSQLGAILTAPLGNSGLFKFTPTATQQAGIGIAIAGAIGIAKLGGLLWAGVLGDAAVFIGLFVLLPVFFGIVAIVVTIIIRQALLVLLAIGSPLAAALYALPNTEKYAFKFVSVTVTTAGVAVVIVVIFAASDIMSYLVIVGHQNVSDAQFTSIIDMVVGYFFTFMPLLAGGFAFKIAGGLVGRGYEFLSGYGKKAHEGILGNPNDPNSLRNLARRRLGASMTQGMKNVMDRGEADGAGFIARQRARLAGSGLFGNVTARQSAYNKAAGAQRAALTDTGDDAEIYAGGGFAVGVGETMPDGSVNDGFKMVNGRNTYVGTRYFSSKADQSTGYNQEISQITYARGKRYYGHNSHEVGESLMYQLGKAQNENDKRAFRVAFGKNAKANNWTQSEMIGAYAHAAYPHKRNHASVWYSLPEYERDSQGNLTGDVKFNDVGDWQDERNDKGQVVGQNHKSYDGMIEDLHKSRGSFDLSGDRHEDFQVMLQWQKQLEQRVIAGSATQADREALGKTYEVFDAVSQRMQTMTDSDGNVTSSGASAASQEVIKSAVNNRQLGMTETDTTTGRRQFFNPGALQAAPVSQAAATAAVAAAGGTLMVQVPPNGAPRFQATTPGLTYYTPGGRYTAAPGGLTPLGTAQTSGRPDRPNIPATVG